MDVNNCTFTGRLTRDAVQKQLQTGTGLIEFDIANNTGYGDHQRCTFIKVNLWGKTGNGVLPYLKKGSPVAVIGELYQNKWTGQDGIEHVQLVLDSSKVTLLPKSNGNVTEADSGADADSGPVPDQGEVVF